MAIDDLTFPQLVGEAGTIVQQLGDAIGSWAECATGTATGGPDDDGLYDVILPGGPVRLPSPAKIAADAAPYAVGLFAALGTRDIPVGVTRIQTTGKNYVGRGGAVYGLTATTGETAWRTQSRDGQWWELLEVVPALWDFGWSDTDCGPVILDAATWAGTIGRTLLIPPATFIFQDRLRITQSGLTLKGVGAQSKLQGPGLYAAGTPNTHNGPKNLTFRSFKMSGMAYQADGNRAIDIHACDEVTIEGMSFEGYHAQVVLDQVQRTRVLRNAFLGAAGTRSGLWYPRGVEAHAGVSLSSSSSNIATVAQNHFNWVANSSGWAIVDHGGLQHAYLNNQVSYGRAAMRLGAAVIVVAGADNEFTALYNIESTNTSFSGEAIGGSPMLNYGPDNYGDRPCKVPHLFALNIRDNNGMRAVSQVTGEPHAAFIGVASIRAVRSEGNKVPASTADVPDRRVLDAVPAVTNYSLLQYDEEGGVPVTRFLSSTGFTFTDPLTVQSLISGRLSTFMLNDGLGRSRLFYDRSDDPAVTDQVEILRMSGAAGYPLQIGNGYEGLGPRVFGANVDPSTITVPGVQDGSFAFRAIPASAAYTSQALLYIRANGAWRIYRAPLQKTSIANLLARTPADWDGAEFVVSDRSSKRAHCDGANWRWADGTIAS